VGNSKWHYSWTCKDSSGTSSCQTKDFTCFLPDVLITMADGTTKPVSQLKLGDAVRGHTQINHVLQLPSYRNNQAIYGFNGSKKFVTGGHPFYTTQGWKAIVPHLTAIEGHPVKTGQLKAGDVLLLDSGKTFTIHSIEQEESGDHTVFNPIMDGDHTYYANAFLVHNKLEPPQVTALDPWACDCVTNPAGCVKPYP
jgi:hypothetical protein